MRLLVVGAGGHAKVVIDAALDAGHTVVGVVGAVSDAASLLGHPIIEQPDAPRADGFIVAIGDNRVRARIFHEYCTAGHIPVSVVHPSAIIGREVTIESGTFAAAGVIVNAGASIGQNVILNTGCSVDHDVVVGAHAHIAPQVALCGGARIGEGALVGVGSSVIPLAAVGDWSVIGAGSAVVSDLPSGSVCVGAPARVVHPVEE